MKLPLYQVDAFTDKIFGGNPACVVPLKEWLPDPILLKIAQENAVAETAFFIDQGDKVHLRWFTPEVEMDLCGHASLAASHAIKQILKHQGNKIIFETLSGDLEVVVNDGLYTLNFPSRMPLAQKLPELLANSLNIIPKKVLKARDFVLVFNSEDDVKNIEINRLYFDQLAGSAHCSLIPYWSNRLGKKELIAKQISERGGTLICKDAGERVLISGKARTFSIGELWTE